MNDLQLWFLCFGIIAGGLTYIGGLFWFLIEKTGKRRNDGRVTAVVKESKKKNGLKAAIKPTPFYHLWSGVSRRMI